MARLKTVQAFGVRACNFAPLQWHGLMAGTWACRMQLPSHSYRHRAAHWLKNGDRFGGASELNSTRYNMVV